ncbi:hypothetical protein OS493_016622 [Desmophyllum pertusum]|uniref:Uncharacterized protein n=1 Tax=Desmophyllum pertusum TaxID=174260 RepID=A0A9W9ZDG3_9CNID|nr:hypothetical protein OS493_016622 [Desmophyllum pertusum]
MSKRRSLHDRLCEEKIDGNFLEEEPKPDSHCADCAGLLANCFCEDLLDCASLGCTDVGACTGGCVKKRSMETFLKREPKPDSHCADCTGLLANCFCEDLDDCANYGCTDFGACTTGCVKKRSMETFLKREPKPGECAICAGFAYGCPCGSLAFCNGCPSTGDCNSGNCGRE